jgi:multiple sugar transport system permease protein
LLVATVATAISLLLAIPAAFSFSRYSGRDAWLSGALAIYMVPPVAFVLPLYFLLQQLGLLNTRPGLVMVYCSLILPFLTWMLKNQFDSLPRDIEQAARLDGLALLAGSAAHYAAAGKAGAGRCRAVRLAARLG